MYPYSQSLQRHWPLGPGTSCPCFCPKTFALAHLSIWNLFPQVSVLLGLLLSLVLSPYQLILNCAPFQHFLSIFLPLCFPSEQLSPSVLSYILLIYCLLLCVRGYAIWGQGFFSILLTAEDSVPYNSYLINTYWMHKGCG